MACYNVFTQGSSWSLAGFLLWGLLAGGPLAAAGRGHQSQGALKPPALSAHMARELAQRCLLTSHPGEAREAVARLLRFPRVGTRPLLQALRWGLAGLARKDALLGLFTGSPQVLAEVLREVVEDRRLLEDVAALPLARGQKQRIAVELLALPQSPGADRWLGLMLGLAGAGIRPAALARLLLDPALQPAIVACACRHPPLAGRPPRPIVKLPEQGLRLKSRAELLALAAAALPVHAPFLLFNLDLQSWPEKAALAARLASLGHPAGLAILRRASHRLDPAVRLAVLQGLARERVSLPGAVRALCSDRDPRVAQEALRVMDADLVALSLPEGLRLLARWHGREARWILQALGRNPDPMGVWEGIHDALEEGRIAAPWIVADWLFGRGPGLDIEVLRAALKDPLQAVRARALEAWLRELPRRRESARVLEAEVEGLARDPDLSVALRAISALGHVKHALARTTLAALSQDASALVREKALLGLGLQEPWHVIPVLRRGLQDKDLWVVNAARLALTIQGHLDPVRALLADLDDPVLGLRTRRVLAGLVKSPWRTRKEFLKAMDREHPRWEHRP